MKTLKYIFIIESAQPICKIFESKALAAIINFFGKPSLGTSAHLVLQDVLECGFKIRETELDDKSQNLSPEERERIFRVINVMVDKEYQ